MIDRALDETGLASDHTFRAFLKQAAPAAEHVLRHIRSALADPEPTPKEVPTPYDDDHQQGIPVFRRIG